MQQPRRLDLEIDAALAGRRVDSLLRRVLCLSGTAVRRAKRMPEGILLDGAGVFTNASVQRGQRLSVRVGDMPSENLPLAMQGDLSIAYEDEDILIVSKPAPLPVHPSPTYFEHTLANYVLYHYAQIGLIADFHPVSRLDNGTSGLMLIAKHAHAHERLAALLHGSAFTRRYLAVCEGSPEEASGCIDAPIGRAEGALLRRCIRADGAKARTHYEVLETRQGRSLLSLRLETGRTHQIRVHMQSLGCPLVGDFLYGVECAQLPRRFALHSSEIELLHPMSGLHLHLKAPLPAALSALLEEPS